MNELIFWAKTSHDLETLPNAYHPLICHMIDVAAVAKFIWRKVLSQAAKSTLQQVLGNEGPDAILAFLAGLHDLGKCSPPFALQGVNLDRVNEDQSGSSPSAWQFRKRQAASLADLYRDKDLWTFPVKKSAEVPHGYVTASELPAILSEEFECEPGAAKLLSLLVGGHHGVFPSAGELISVMRGGDPALGSDLWGKARRDLTLRLAEFCDVRTLRDVRADCLESGTKMILAGLVSVSDWIGSNTEFFPCRITDSRQVETQDPRGFLADYAPLAELAAEKALFELGWIQTTIPTSLSVEERTGDELFNQLFPNIKKRRHLQDVVIDVSETLDRPGIAVIEAPTGEGKTEAAMFLADAWNSRLQQHGYYFALPTQATSDQLFSRAVEFLDRRYPNSNVNVQLVHGHASLSSEFEILKQRHKNVIKGIFDDQCEGEDCASNIAAAEWFTNRKRSLLAPFGIGTIDQSLMAVLQTRHVFVRLFGLSHKTIIFDEVHAYDTYMSTLLERLVEWLAALSSSVIILSATLPITKRNALIRAYQRGAGQKVSVPTENGKTDVSGDVYPRLSYWVSDNTKVRILRTSDLNRRSVGIEVTEKEVAVLLKARLKRGGCAAVICNSVKRAQDLYLELALDPFFSGESSDGGPKLDLLHSRFRYIDRKKREERCIRRFGKQMQSDLASDRPDLAVLISTQIIEQSLDLDFDLMISDLAPIDLIIQRMGRLHRHAGRERPQGLDRPTVYIPRPGLLESGRPDFSNSAVYDKHILLRTWLAISKLSKVLVPHDIEELIENVYGETDEPAGVDPVISEFWRETEECYRKSVAKEQAEASVRFIKKPQYRQHFSGIFSNVLEEDSPEIHRSLQAVTRLAGPSVSVVCLWSKNGQLTLQRDSRMAIDLSVQPMGEQIGKLLERAMTISMKPIVFHLMKESPPQGWKRSPHLRNHRVLIFNDDGECESFGYRFVLDPKVGLKTFRLEGDDV